MKLKVIYRKLTIPTTTYKIISMKHIYQRGSMNLSDRTNQSYFMVRCENVRTHHPIPPYARTNPWLSDCQNHQRHDRASSQSQPRMALPTSLQIRARRLDYCLYRSKAGATGRAAITCLRNYERWAQALSPIDAGYHLESRGIRKVFLAKGILPGISTSCRTGVPDRSLYQLLPDAYPASEGASKKPGRGRDALSRNEPCTTRSNSARFTSLHQPMAGGFRICQQLARERNGAGTR